MVMVMVILLRVILDRGAAVAKQKDWTTTEERKQRIEMVTEFIQKTSVKSS